MSVWDGFKSIISQSTDLVGRIAQGGPQTAEQFAREKQFNDNIKNAIATVDKIPVVGKAVVKSSDFVLKAAVALNNNVISPYITRPMSTIALLSDKNSPLYQKGEHEAGFQVADIAAAYERSAKVSTMQALTRSNIIPLVSDIAGAVLKQGKINPDEINLWGDKSIQKNFIENDIGRWFTGVGDFALGNFGIGVVGKIAKIPVIASATKAGIYTKTKTLEQFATDIKTPGTVANSHAITLAESKDIGTISDIVHKYSTNEALIPILYEVKTSEIAADILLADKGMPDAIERLFKAAPSDLFELAGGKAILANKFLTTGNVHIPEGPGVPRLKAAYDHAIEKDPQFVKIRDAFMDEHGNQTVSGRAFMPMEPKYGLTETLIKAEGKMRDLKTAARFREFDRLGEILEIHVGGKIGTRIVKFSTRQGELSPQGFVTFSGSRPGQARTELNAFLNNIQLFNDGTKKITIAPGITEKVGDIRRRMEIDFVQSGTGIDQLKALEKIDAEVGRLLMYQHGVFGEEEILNHIKNYRNKINTNIEGFRVNGYAYDHTGERIITTPQTLAQLKDSYRFTPWDHIERDLQMDAAKASGKVRAGALQTAHSARHVLDEFNRLWTFDVLARPMFIVKQSIAEPLIGATLAQGLDIIWKYSVPMSIRLFKNTTNSIYEVASRVHNHSDLKAVKINIDAQQTKFSEISAIKDRLQTEVEGMLKGTHSPAAVKSNLKAARANLAAANELLDNIELDLRNSVKKYGVSSALPNMTMLERRMDFIRKNPGKLSGKSQIDLAAAQQAVDNYKLVIRNMATNSKAIQEADTALGDAYKNIDNLVQEQGKLFVQRADIHGKSAEYKKRYYDKSTHDVIVNGQVMSIDSFIASDAPFAQAMRAEVANAVSVENTYLKEMAVGSWKEIFARNVPGEPIRVSDANYFEELAYLANRHYRNDPLMNLILQNKSLSELTRWGNSQEGISYLKNFDIITKDKVSPYIQDKIALMDRMFPSATARAAIIKGEVTSNDLEKTLANYNDQLFDIHPTTHDYGVADGVGRKSIGKIIDATAAATFKFMMKAENPIREMYFNEIATKEVARKANILVSQGVEMTPARLNALRQSSVREAIQNTEKTFYTVHNQTRIMKNARLFVAFPNATLNAFARYGRLAAMAPVRTAQAVSSYGRGFMSFGVDQSGNKTDDFNKITHIVLPGSKELGNHFKAIGLAEDGFALNAKSIGFLLNQPSPSWMVGMSVGTVMKSFPTTEDSIKNTINVLGTDTYDQWFPFGPPTDLTNMMITPWMRATYNALVGPVGQKEFLASSVSVYNYHKTMIDLGIETTFPTAAQLRTETKALWAVKAFYSFASPFGVPIKSNTNPMGLAGALYFKLRDAALSSGKTTQEADDAAASGMLAALGPKFIVDRVSYTGSNKNLNMPQTQEAYARIFIKNGDLVKKLSGIDKNTISLVGLLVADLNNDPAKRSTAVANVLSNPSLVLPGTSHPVNDLKMTPEEVETERIKNRAWTEYNQVKDALTAKITDGTTLRSHPELSAILTNFVETSLKNESPAWYDDFMLAQHGDKSYKYAMGLNLIIHDDAFMKANGNTPFWKDVVAFMDMRTQFAAIYNILPSGDPRKANVMDRYNAYTAMNVSQWNPKLQTIIKNSFDNDTLKEVN